MQFPGVKTAIQTNPQQRVYVSLDALIRLQFRIRDVGFLPRQPVHSILNGRYASRLRGRGLNFEELRGYLPGDDTRTIDWKVTARTRKPYVRVYSEERDRPLILLVDQRRSMFFGSSLNMKSVTAAETAAIAAWRSLALGDRVGAIIFDDQQLREYKPLRSRQRVTQILAGITKMNHELGSGQGITPQAGRLNQALDRAFRLAGHDALVCLVSDGFGADSRSRSTVTRINAHNDVLIAYVYDPLEARLPTDSDLRFSDGELQLGISAKDHAAHRAFERQFELRRETMQSLSIAQQIPFLPMSTARPTADQVRELLGRHTAAKSNRR
jgi:uncharacterized protein (DUF58 family)